MIKRIRVGVKSPVTGTGIAVAIAVGVGVKVAFGVAAPEALGFIVGVGVTVTPDCDAVKAGTSPALTTKSRVKNLVIPLASIQEIVIVWFPGVRLVGTE